MSHQHCPAFDAKNMQKPNADTRVVVSGHTICAEFAHKASSRSQLQTSRLTSPGICCEKTFLKGQRKIFPFIFENFKQLCLRKPSHAKLCTNDTAAKKRLYLISKTNGTGPPPTFGPTKTSLSRECGSEKSKASVRDSHQSDVVSYDVGACGRPNTSTISNKVLVLSSGTRGKTCERLSSLRLLGV